MQSISKNIGNHVKLSALHGRLHLFSMGKVMWIVKHIVSRFVILHFGALCGIVVNKIVNHSISFPVMADSNIYVKVWANGLLGIGMVIGIIGSVVGLIGLLIMFIFIGWHFWDWQ